jgi:hypothetical protein
VVFAGMVFGPVVGLVRGSWAPINLELVLALPISKPMEMHMHMHCFGGFWLDFVVHHAPYAVEFSVCMGVGVGGGQFL